MKHKLYLLLLSLPLLISVDLFNQSVLKQDSRLLFNLEASSFSLVDTWQVNGPAFFYPNTETYTLSPKGFEFGHFVEFKKDNTFKGYYRAPCGNDCFTQINGTYILKDDTIDFFVLSAKQTGFCSNPTSFSNKKIGTFKITEKTKDTLLLKRI